MDGLSNTNEIQEKVNWVVPFGIISNRMASEWNFVV